MKEGSLLEYFESRLPDALEDLRILVDLESHSLDKPGIDALVEHLTREFRARSAEVEVAECDSRGNVLQALWPGGREPGPVMLLGHLDTVWPRGTIQRRPFRIDGGLAYGPGVFDMKSGILVCLMVCRALQEGRVRPASDVLFFFTADEEIGTETGVDKLRERAAGCRAVLCLEPSLPGGWAKTSRKGVGIFRIRVEGITAHAGVDHDKGANAIVELSRQLILLQGLTDYGRGITINVGTVRGGTASNVVAAEAEAEVDFRVPSISEACKLEEKFRSLAPFDPRCTVHASGGLNRPPLERTPAVVELFLKARGVASDLGMDLGEGSSGGGSDGSFTSALGIPTLDGLGVEGDGAHAVHEHIRISDIPRRAALLGSLIARL